MAELSATGEPAQPDHLGIALRGLVAGVLAGLAAVAVVMWVVRSLQASGHAPLAPRPSDTIATVILAGWMGGSILGGVATWALLAPIRSAYRRGGLAMVAGFGSLLFSFLTAPADSLFGRPGLLGLAVLSILLFAWQARAIVRRARQVAASPAP